MLMNRRGFGLIEVMVSVAIMSIIMVGATQMITDFNKNVKEVRTMANRDQIVELIKHYASNYAAINASAPAGSNLRRCIDGTGAGTCNSAATMQPLELRDTANTRTVAGAAVFYTRDGALCPVAVGSDQCPIQARAWFSPDCYPAGCPPITQHGEYIIINYSITRVAGVTGLVFRGACTSDVVGCAAPDPVISVAVPMFTGLAPGVAGRVPHWTSTLGWTQSTLEVIPVTGNIMINRKTGAAVGADCGIGVTNSGTLRTNNGALQVCDGTSGLWKHAGGRMDSSVSSSALPPGRGLPNLPNLYICPAGGNTATCGGAVTCMGQVTRQPAVAAVTPTPANYFGGGPLPAAGDSCCMDRFIWMGPLAQKGDARFGQYIGASNSNAACTPLF